MDGWTLAGITSAVTALLTLALTKGVDALLKYRGDRRLDSRYEDERVVKGYEFVIGKLEARTATLETLYTKAHQDHLECVRVQEHLRGLDEQKTIQIAALEKKQAELEHALQHLRENVGEVVVKQAISEERLKHDSGPQTANPG